MRALTLRTRHQDSPVRTASDLLSALEQGDCSRASELLHETWSWFGQTHSQNGILLLCKRLAAQGFSVERVWSVEPGIFSFLGPQGLPSVFSMSLDHDDQMAFADVHGEGKLVTVAVLLRNGKVLAVASPEPLTFLVQKRLAPPFEQPK